MKWLRPLYVGKKIKKNVRRTIDVIEGREEKRGFVFFYLIALSSHADENLEIMPVFTLRQLQRAGQEPVILGLARDRKEAKQMTLGMLNDCMKNGGGLDLKAYFEGLGPEHYVDGREVGL